MKERRKERANTSKGNMKVKGQEKSEKSKKKRKKQ